MISPVPLNFIVLFINVVLSCVLFLLLKKRFQDVDRILLVFSLFLFFVYSGFGAAYEGMPLYYLLMYNIFIFVFFYTFTFVQRLRLVRIKSSSLTKFFKYSNTIIFVYLVLTFFNAGYPDFNLVKLVKPNAPALSFDPTNSFKNDLIRTILYYILLLIQPFYLISVYRYRYSVRVVFILLLLPLYFYFSLGGYVARSYLLPYLVMFLYIVYYYHPYYRKLIKYLASFSVLPVIFFSYYFSEVRIGHEFGGIKFFDAISFLFFQESSFPLHYLQLLNSQMETQIIDFFKWLLMLPIPSFLKGDSYSIDINNYFTYLITGRDIDAEGFFVLLPGTTLESYLIFGKYLFFLLPFFGAIITGILYKLMKSVSEFMILRVYFIFMFIPLITRAGFFSAIPIAINGFLLFYFYLGFLMLKSKK